jgi:hypothetical protein
LYIRIIDQDSMKGRMAMFKLKGCPRCHGDIYLDKDLYGVYEQCIQCGYMLYQTPVKAKKQAQPVKRLQVTAAGVPG